MTSLEPEIWFFVQAGRRVGPFNRTGLLRELLAQEAPEAVLVWRSGLAGWTKASLLDDLRRDLPPPVPGAPLPRPPTPELPDPPMPELPQSPADASASSTETPLSDDLTGETAESRATEDEAPRELRRKRRRRREKAAALPGYAIPLVLLFVAVMIGLWFLLRRMNEVPPGRIILQGALGPSIRPPLTDSRPGVTPA